MANGWIAALGDLVLGADCPGCGRAELGLCRRCLAELRPDPAETPSIGVDLRVIASGDYSGVTERVVRRLKGPGHAHAAAWASAALASSVAAHGLDDVALTPVPATRRSRRRRGGWLVKDLTLGAIPLLRAVGVRAELTPVVRMSRQTRDQRGLGIIERARNTRGAFRAAPGTGRQVLITDDVVTTGATLQAVAVALETAGHAVAGAAVVAATPPHFVRRITGECPSGRLTSE